jgi:hypothetical protein
VVRRSDIHIHKLEHPPSVQTGFSSFFTSSNRPTSSLSHKPLKWIVVEQWNQVAERWSDRDEWCRRDQGNIIWGSSDLIISRRSGNKEGSESVEGGRQRTGRARRSLALLISAHKSSPRESQNLTRFRAGSRLKIDDKFTATKLKRTWSSLNTSSKHSGIFRSPIVWCCNDHNRRFQRRLRCMVYEKSKGQWFTPSVNSSILNVGRVSFLDWAKSSLSLDFYWERMGNGVVIGMIELFGKSEWSGSWGEVKCWKISKWVEKWMSWWKIRGNDLWSLWERGDRRKWKTATLVEIWKLYLRKRRKDISLMDVWNLTQKNENTFKFSWKSEFFGEILKNESTLRIEPSNGRSRCGSILRMAPRGNLKSDSIIFSGRLSPIDFSRRFWKHR